jgi:hypothetical protein
MILRFVFVGRVSETTASSMVAVFIAALSTLQVAPNFVRSLRIFF